MTILFRVNGSSSIGIGHVTECITLAHELPGTIVFAINDHPAPRRLMEQEGISYKIIPGDDKEIGNSFQHVIDTLKPTIIVFDLPWVNQGEVNKLRFGHAKTVFLNALYHPVKGDLHITTVFTPLPENKQYTGMEYIILRREFTSLTPKPVPEKVKKVLVMFGGSDKNGYTLKALDALQHIDAVELLVVVGVSFTYHRQLEELLKEYPKKVSVYKNVQNILPIMQQADLGVISGGYTAAELCKVGVPLVVLCQTPIEKERIFPQFDAAIINLGIGVEVSSAQLQEAIITLLGNKKERERLVQAGSKLLEGNGAKRIAALIRRII